MIKVITLLVSIIFIAGCSRPEKRFDLIYIHEKQHLNERQSIRDQRIQLRDSMKDENELFLM